MSSMSVVVQANALPAVDPVLRKPAAHTVPCLETLFARYFDFLWRQARRLGLDDAEADDAAQSVFIVASRKLASIEPGKERSFLFGTLVRVVADVRKRAARRPASLEDLGEFSSDGDAPDVALDRERARRLLDIAIEALPWELRTVFVLFELEELTMVEIAEMLDLPPGTVASRLRRAREVFFETMERARARGLRPGKGRQS